MDKIVSFLKRRAPEKSKAPEKRDPRLCVVDTLVSIVNELNPDNTFEDKRVELDADRKQHAEKLNELHRKKIIAVRKAFAPLVKLDHEKYFVKMMRESEKHEAAAYRLDRMDIRHLYEKVFAELSQSTGDHYELNFIQSNSAEDISKYLSDGYQVAVVIQEMFGSLHVFHIAKNAQNELVDKSSATAVVGLEDKDTRLVAEERLTSGLLDQKREVTQDGTYLKGLWNTILVKKQTATKSSPNSSF